MSDFVFVVDKPTKRLDLFLAQMTGESRGFIQHQMKAGRISVNGNQVTKAASRLHTGDRIEGRFQEKTTRIIPVPGPLDIVFEDEDLLVLNKAPGVVVHPAFGHSQNTLVHFLLYHLNHHAEYSHLSPTRPGIVHRLDRGTSGILLVAKNRRSLEGLSSQFRSREIKKVYESIVWGVVPPSGRVLSSIGRHRIHRQKMSSTTKNGREALTVWERLRQYPRFAHLRIFPHTGRTHQIRVHLSESGYPIVGDKLYGPRSGKPRSEAVLRPIQTALEESTYPLLHAKEISFVHPRTGKPLQFEAPHSKNFAIFLNCLQNLDSRCLETAFGVKN